MFLPLKSISSKDNIADLATRSAALLSIGLGSLWQSEPKGLSEPYTNWPATWSFAKEELPESECKNTIKILLGTLYTTTMCPLVIMNIMILIGK